MHTCRTLAWSLWQRSDWCHVSQVCLSSTHEPWELKNTSRTDDQRHADDSSELCHIYWQSARTVTLNTSCTSAALQPRSQDTHITEVCQVYQSLERTFLPQCYNGLRPTNTRTFCRTEWQRTNSVARSFPHHSLPRRRKQYGLVLPPPSPTSQYKSSFPRSLTCYIRLHEDLWNIVCHLLGNMAQPFSIQRTIFSSNVTETETNQPCAACR